MPFLEILTRCCRRPAMLAANQASLATLTSPDWTQSLLVDDVGRGIGWASQNMGAYAPHLVGDYIWILDDDDLCTCNTLVVELKAITRLYRPEVIMLRMDHGEMGVLPDITTWRLRPQLGHIGVSAYVVKRSTWQAHAGAWASARYESDFDFIDSIWRSNPVVYWHACIASRVQRISRGMPE